MTVLIDEPYQNILGGCLKKVFCLSVKTARSRYVDRSIGANICNCYSTLLSSNENLSRLAALKKAATAIAAIQNICKAQTPLYVRSIDFYFYYISFYVQYCWLMLHSSNPAPGIHSHNLYLFTPYKIL